LRVGSKGTATRWREAGDRLACWVGDSTLMRVRLLASAGKGG